MNDSHAITGPAGEPAPTSPGQLFRRLDALDIRYTAHHHAPVFTVEEAKHLRGVLPGGHCKSLFLRDKRGASWLVVCEEDRRVDLKSLATLLQAGRFSFASPERLWAALGVVPGSVTPFALINDAPPSISVVLDEEMMRHGIVNYHPLRNDQTIAVTPSDLVKFIEACGHRPHIMSLDLSA